MNVFTVALTGIQHLDQTFFINTKNRFTYELVLALEKKREPSSHQQMYKLRVMPYMQLFSYSTPKCPLAPSSGPGQNLCYTPGKKSDDTPVKSLFL